MEEAPGSHGPFPTVLFQERSDVGGGRRSVSKKLMGDTAEARGPAGSPIFGQET